MTETENGDTTPLKQKKREGSRLDRGFPMGKILLIILGFVFFFQIISAWKIINLEKEKGKLEDEKTIFETNKENYHFIMQKLPELQRENGELEIVRQELRGKINDLKLESTQVAEELKNNQKKSNKLKLANDAAKNNLRETDIRASKREEERALAFGKFVELSGKANNLKQEIENYGKEKDILKEDLGKLNVKMQNLKNENNRLISDNAAIDARLKATEDELKKLRGAKTDLAGIISNLKVTSESFNSTTNTIKESQSASKDKFEDAVKALNTATRNITSSTQKFEKSQSEANDKFKEAVVNLNNKSSKLEEVTISYSNKIDLATGRLNNNVEQLSTTKSELSNLSVQLNNSANKVENELKIIDQRLNASETNQKQLKELLANVTRISGSLSSDSSVLNNTLKELKEDVGGAVQKLGVATSNIESNSNDFKEKVSTLDVSNRELDSLLEFIYRELDNTKQRQIAMVDNFQELVSRIGTTSANLDKDLLEFRKTFEQIEKDSSNALEGVKGLKDNIKEVEKIIESLNIGTKKPNEKEEE